MTISANSPATSSNLNESFISKKSDSVTVGKVGLNSLNSGEQITNTQLEINTKTFKPYAEEQISSGNTIASSTTMGMQRRKIVSDGGLVTISSTPFGGVGGWADGLQIRLRGNSDSNTIKIVHNDSDYGCILNGDIILTKWAQITLEWDLAELRWYEISRNI